MHLVEYKFQLPNDMNVVTLIKAKMTKIHFSHLKIGMNGNYSED